MSVNGIQDIQEKINDNTNLITLNYFVTYNNWNKRDTFTISQENIIN